MAGTSEGELVGLVDRRELPFRVVEGASQRILTKYSMLAKAAAGNIRDLLSTPALSSKEEAVLQSMDKTLNQSGDAMFKEGDKVQVQQHDGEWTDGVVTKPGDLLKVLRADGETRAYPPEKVRLPGAEVVSGVWLRKFDVLLPSGSKSLEIDIAIAPITDEMNSTPLHVDEKAWENNLIKVAEQTQQQLQYCEGMAKSAKFNPGSSKDCAQEFGELRKFTLGRTPKGAVSVDQGVLERIANAGDPLAPQVIKYRELRTHLSQLEKWAPYAQAGEVRPSWDQHGQPHGRYSCDSPNLTNRVLEIRQTVVAAPGCVFVSGDWGSAEYVTWASLSKDKTLGEIFSSGRDLHSEMGASLAKICGLVSDEPKVIRDFGKTVNFALLYLMLTPTLAKTLGVSMEVAAALVAEYQRKAPDATLYIKEVLAKAARNGFVETYFGRRLMCPDLRHARGSAKHQMEKTVWHHHNAGTAAELLKLKAVEIRSALLAKGLKSGVEFALNMFDEVILQVRQDLAPGVQDLVKSVMAEQVPDFLPFKVDARSGHSWLDISK